MGAVDVIRPAADYSARLSVGDTDLRVGMEVPGKTLVAILPRGEAIRNFVYSGTLDRVQAEADLSVLSVVPDSDTFAMLIGRYGHVRQLEAPIERYPVRLLREVLDIAHGRNLWSEAARERWRLRDTEANTPIRRVKRLAKKAGSLPFASRRGIRVLERAERLASRALRRSTSYESYYRSLRPSLVFNGSHVHSRVAIQAVQEAQWLGIPTATFMFSWDNLTSQGRCIPAYDYYLVWNSDIKQQLLDVYPHVRHDQVFVTGTPQFDFHFRRDAYWSREEFCARTGTDPHRPLVLYSTGMADAYTDEPRVVEQIADMLREFDDLGSPQLLVRVYPKDLTGRFDALKTTRPDVVFPPAQWVDRWLTPTEADTRLLTNTLRHVDVGVNVASTVSLELCMFDKPVVNVGYDPPNTPRVRVPYARYYEYDHYRPIVASGAVQLARTPGDMRRMLREALENPAAHTSERTALMQRMFGATLDGHSNERVARVLLELASRSVHAAG